MLIIGLSTGATKWNGMASVLLEDQVVPADLKIYDYLTSRHEGTPKQCAVINIILIWSICGE